MSSEPFRNAVGLRVEIERLSDPIEGRLVDSAGRVSGFRGWLQLSAALEAARRGETVDIRDDGA